MGLTQEQQQRLADSLLGALVGSGAVRLKVERGVVAARIAALLQEEFTAEEDLEREAQTLLEKHLRQAPPGVDRHKLLQMIKKRLAEERGVPL